MKKISGVKNGYLWLIRDSSSCVFINSFLYSFKLSLPLATQQHLTAERKGDRASLSSRIRTLRTCCSNSAQRPQVKGSHCSSSNDHHLSVHISSFNNKAPFELSSETTLIICPNNKFLNYSPPICMSLIPIINSVLP